MNTDNSFHPPIEDIRALMKSVGRILEMKPGNHDLDTEILCAEVSLLCLCLSDNIENGKLNEAEVLKWRETAQALGKIAFGIMGLTSDAEKDEDEDPQKAWDKTLNYISGNADYICRLLDFPFTVSGGAVTEALVPVLTQSLDALGGTVKNAKDSTVAITPIVENDERRRVALEIRELREELSRLIAEKAHLENDECLRLSAAYAVNIGTLLSELYLAEVEVNKAKRKLQLMQAALNRRQKPEVKNIEEQLNKEYAQFREKYEDYVSREQEARAYQRRQAESEKNRQQWRQQHEREHQETDGDNMKEPGSEPNGKRENISDYMKNLYRKLAKALHPDLHPDQPPEHLDLFKRVSDAYSKGDLQTLEMVWELLQNDSAPTPESENVDELEQLIREKLRLLELIKKLRKEIEDITSRFPYTMRSILDDPEKLAAKQNEIRNQIKNTEAVAAHFAARIDELEKKL